MRYTVYAQHRCRKQGEGAYHVVVNLHMLLRMYIDTVSQHFGAGTKNDVANMVSVLVC